MGENPQKFMDTVASPDSGTKVSPSSVAASAPRFFDVRTLGYIDKISVFDIAHSASDRAVFSDGVAQLKPTMAYSLCSPVAAEEIIHCLVRPGAVKIIGVYDRKRSVHDAAAAEHRMSRAPGLSLPSGTM